MLAHRTEQGNAPETRQTRPTQFLGHRITQFRQSESGLSSDWLFPSYVIYCQTESNFQISSDTTFPPDPLA
jgi:hypothetical protein